MTPHDKQAVHRQIVARLRQQGGDVRRLASGLDETTLATRTLPDKWSLKELVCHLRRVQQIFETRIDTLLREDNPVIASYEPDGDAEFDRMVAEPAAASLTRFLAERERLAARLDRLEPAEWHRRGRHPEFPHYDLHFQVEYMLHHEAHHIYQMYQRRAPLGKVPH